MADLDSGARSSCFCPTNLPLPEHRYGLKKRPRWHPLLPPGPAYETLAPYPCTTSRAPAGPCEPQPGRSLPLTLGSLWRPPHKMLSHGLAPESVWCRCGPAVSDRPPRFKPLSLAPNAQQIHHPSSYKPMISCRRVSEGDRSSISGCAVICSVPPPPCDLVAAPHENRKRQVSAVES